MNKNAIKKFAIDARKKLIASVTDKAGMLGITPDKCSEAVTKGADFEVYQTAAGTEVTLNKKQCEQRRKLVKQIYVRGFEAVIEEVAYTWFNRICAIRFMEVNDYMYPVRVRVLSSEKKSTVSGLVKNEPDVVTMAPDIDWNFTDKEREEIIDAKMNNRLDDLFRMLFIKQCNLLHEVLPGLFEETEDYTEMLLNISFTNEDDVVHMLVDREKGIPEEDFNVNTLDENGNPTGQVEIIGWLYQYYNTELKDDTFAKLKKNIKISKERIPAATQLFTPDWIVRYMVENSVGRIWIEHLRAVDPRVDEKKTAEKFGWKYYLPEAEQEESVNVKLAEIRATYKDLKPEDITCIDPCMGSGHILVAMFDVLMDIYESAGYDKREAAFEIVEHNIHGLDIDKRAYQLTYFAVMMKGRGYNRRFLNIRDGATLEPKVYAIEESNEINRNHLQFFGLSMEEKDREKAEQQIRYLLDTFVDAREYGSILDVEECDWKLLERFVEDLQVSGQFTLDRIGCDETQNQLGKLINVAKNLERKYDAVVTNPPYMSNKGMSAKVINYVQKNYPDSKADLFAIFMEKCENFTARNGLQAMITQHSWMFLSSFEKLRAKMLNCEMINMAHLGARAFEEIGGEVVQTTSFVRRRGKAVSNYFANYARLVDGSSQGEKERMFLDKRHLFTAKQQEFSNVPGMPIAYWQSNVFFGAFLGKLLNDVYETKKGMFTGNNDYFLKLWYEIASYKIGEDFRLYNKGGGYRRWYGHNDIVVRWHNGGIEIKNASGSGNINESYFFKACLSWNLVSTAPFCCRIVEKNNVMGDAGPICLIRETDENYYYVLAYLNSVVCNNFMSVLNPTMNYPSSVVGKLPLVISASNRDRVTSLSKDCVEISRIDWDSYETSWNFHNHPLFRKVTTIVDAFEQWQNECGTRFNRLKANEEKLNQIFIEIYGLQDELMPEVEEKDVTVTKAVLSRDIRSFISYAVGCMFGRYSLDEEGLILAGQPLESHFHVATASMAGSGVAGKLGLYLPTGEYYYKDENGEIKKCSFSPDADNIIPITDEEYFTDDIVGRFVEFVETVYGKDTLEENLDFIAQALGNKGNSSRKVIRNYFIKDFYKDHLKVYQKRPIYWLFDSGKQNGFKALIYMHRYDADTVGRVRTDYLHKAQKYVETAMQSAQYTIDNSTSASEKSKATKAVTKYTKQLAEMKIYDEAIAHVANQRIEIDLDDGVKVNYAKFQGVEVAQEGKKALKVDLLAKI